MSDHILYKYGEASGKGKTAEQHKKPGDKPSPIRDQEVPREISLLKCQATIRSVLGKDKDIGRFPAITLITNAKLVKYYARSKLDQETAEEIDSCYSVLESEYNAFHKTKGHSRIKFDRKARDFFKLAKKKICPLDATDVDSQVGRYYSSSQRSLAETYPSRSDHQSFERESTSKSELFRDAHPNILARRLNVEEVEYLMQTDDIVRSEEIKRSTSGELWCPNRYHYKITLRCGIVCIFKPQYSYITNSRRFRDRIEFSRPSGYFPKREVDTYQADKMYELGQVPLTVWRKLDDGREGSAQIWVNNLVKGDAQMPNDAMIFDYLTGQLDRITYYNFLEKMHFNPYYHRNVNWARTPDLPCVLYDNERSFGLDVPDIPPEMIRQFIPTSQDRLIKFQTLDMEGGENFLSKERKEAFRLRRDKWYRTIQPYLRHSASGQYGYSGGPLDSSAPQVDWSALQEYRQTGIGGREESRFGPFDRPPASGSGQVVAPNESDTQTLVGQSSDCSSSKTLVSSDKVQAQGQDGEGLKESLRSIVQEYRQAGIVTSSAPTLRGMTEGQILLEVLSHSDFLKKLKEKGIEANERTFQLMQQTLNMILETPMPFDYNPARAIRNFNEALDKLDLAALQVAPVDLPGGLYYDCNTHTNEYVGRIMVLTDPKGKRHTFDKGQENDDIAFFTTQRIEQYKDEYAQPWINAYQQRGYFPRSQQIREHKDQYSGGGALTERDVELLKKGDTINGWTCTDLTYFDIPKTFRYTDEGEEIHALNTSRYQACSIAEVYNDPSLRVTRGPTPAYNCHSAVHLAERLWLVPGKFGKNRESNSQILRILKDNGYRRIVKRKAKRGDLVFYWKKRSAVPHEGVVVSNINGKIRVKSKLGHGIATYHDIDNSFVKHKYGRPFVYHSDRRDENGRKSNLLRRTRP